MLEWTPASTPPKKTGAYLVRCTDLDDPSQKWLALAYRARGLTQWIEMYRGGLCDILIEGEVTFWQPAQVPQCSERQARRWKAKAAAGQPTDQKETTGG